ncbi:MAG TPA: LmeA family phospholipid-binding protein [Trebonia sp.]|nr:LmeA family phospholipid-binding protein [Trebonia sp.]
MAGAAGVGAAAPTRVRPQVQPSSWAGQSAQPSFTPAQPSFTPAQQGQGGPAGPDAQDAQDTDPGGVAGQPGIGGQAEPPTAPHPGYQPSGWPEQSFQVGEAAPDPGQGSWPKQPPQYSPEPGWSQGPSGSQGPHGSQGAYGSQGPYGPPPQGGRPGGGRRSRQDYQGYPGGRRPRRRHRVRRSVMALFAIIVLAILATIGDRVANAIAENEIANQFVKNGFPVKPSVTIEGFPFLTQLVAHNIHDIDISASNVPAGPVTITSVKGKMTGVHLNSSFNGGKVDHITGTLFVSFSSLAAAGGGGTGTGISMSADGSDKVKITAEVAGQAIDTEVAKVSQTAPNQISIQVQPSGSPLSGLLTSFGSYSFPIPKLPAGMRVTGVSVTSQGITVSAAANNTTLTQPGS